MIEVDSVKEPVAVDELHGVDEDPLPLLVTGGGEKLVLVGKDSVVVVEHVVSETPGDDADQEAVQRVSVIVSVSVMVSVSVVVDVSV